MNTQDYPFVWDEDKNKINMRKHGVSFQEATSVFEDENAVYLDDIAHSQDEERFIVIGLNSMSMLLMVCHCYRDNDSVVRIISARKATKPEATIYRR